MNIILDTQILIWIFKGHDDDDSIAQRARDFFNNLLEQVKAGKINIIYPTIILGELLFGIEEDRKKQEFVKYIDENFIIADYDVISAYHTSDIWQTYRIKVVDTKMKFEKSNMLIKCDCKIIGTALANNVNCIYSEDPDIFKLASGYIDAQHIPEQTTQQDIPI